MRSVRELEVEPTVRRIPRAAAARRPKASQLPWAAALLAAIVAFGYYAVARDAPRAGFVWAIGVAFGFTLQRARFCFTAAMRDPVLTGSTSLTKAVVVGLAVGSLGFTALQLGAYFRTGKLAEAMKLASLDPVGPHIVVGGVLFGVGAVIAGGCASGTLLRVGEGFLQQVLALPFFVVGSALGAATWPLWKAAFRVDPATAVWLPDALGGFLPAVAVQFGLLLALWLAADWWGRHGAAPDDC
jgi:uncharacterized protein